MTEQLVVLEWGGERKHALSAAELNKIINSGFSELSFHFDISPPLAVVLSSMKKVFVNLSSKIYLGSRIYFGANPSTLTGTLEMPPLVFYRASFIGFIIHNKPPPTTHHPSSPAALYLMS